MATRSSSENEAWLKSSSAGETGVPSQSYKKGDSNNVCSRRTLLEKILLVVLLLTLAALLVVTVFLALARSNPDIPKKEMSPYVSESPTLVKFKDTEICLTKDCVNAASRIDSSIDYSVSPCDDLHKFACGKWDDTKAVPEEESSISVFSLLRKEISIILRNVLQVDNQPGDLDCVEKAKDFYASCIDTDTINARGDGELRAFLEDLGGWPIVHAHWDESKFDLVDVLVKVNQINLMPVFGFYIGLNSKNSSMRILTIDQPAFGMPGQKYYQVSRDDKMLQAYEQYIVSIVKTLGGANEGTLEAEAREIVDFEIRLANISTPDEKRRDSNALYNPMTLREIQASYSEIVDWPRYIRSVLQQPDISVMDIGDEEVINNQSPLYFNKLKQIMKTTPKRVLANYVMWRVAKMLVSTLGDNYNDLYMKYSKVVFGTSTQPDRYRECVDLAVAHLGLAVGRMFIKDNFRVEAKQLALDMIAELQSSFNELLDEVDWMDTRMRAVAKEKNDFISVKIGYSEKILNDTYLNERFSNLTFNRATYFENMLASHRDQYNREMRDLRKPLDKKRWDGIPVTVNAFYHSAKNQIMFPAGILQRPFFSTTYPRSLIFGGIGFVIGHELTHGFDDEGRQWDKHGNLVNWWSEEALRKFKNKAQCFVDQYGNFTVEGIDMNLNGVNTQGENIADNGGLKQAFRAYRNWVKQQGREEPLLPGLSFTHNQLFFINFAQIWCEMSRGAYAVQQIRTGRHSPARFRIIGTAQNSPEFAKAFNCPKNSYMNPSKKCIMW